MSSLSARMKMVQSKMNGLEWSQHFSHYIKDYGDFSRRLKAANSAVHDLIRLHFELSQELSLLPARMKKIRSKMNELECSQQYALIFKMLKGS